MCMKYFISKNPSREPGTWHAQKLLAERVSGWEVVGEASRRALRWTPLMVYFLVPEEENSGYVAAESKLLPSNSETVEQCFQGSGGNDFRLRILFACKPTIQVCKHNKNTFRNGRVQKICHSSTLSGKIAKQCISGKMKKQIRGEGVVNTKSGGKRRQNLFKVTVDRGEWAKRTSESPSASSGIKIPDDLDLGGSRAKERSKSMKRFLTYLERS